MIPRLALTRYRLPLRRPWRTAHGVRHERVGWLVQASYGGRCGYGDCAPLPEAGTETPMAAAERLSTWLRDHGASAPEIQLALLSRAVPSTTPAADAALETALLDLCARLGERPLRVHLAREGDRASATTQEPITEPELLPTPNRLEPASEIELNAAFGAVVDVPRSAVDEALAAGFRVLKIKVGVALIEQEVAAILRLCSRLPAGARLRLDANRGWSREAAGMVLDDLRPAARLIESLEEPCGDATNAELRALQAKTSIALALDESLSVFGWPLDPERLPLRRMVLKPAVIGGLRPTLALAQRARAAGREVVITSMIESAAGLWSSAQLAAASGSKLAHGLATSDWLAEDLGPAPAIEAGHVRLPDCPGSGFSPDNPTVSLHASR